MLLLLQYSILVKAATVDSVAVIKDIAAVMKGIKNVSYKYTVNVRYSDGKMDMARGELYTQNDEQMMLNDCDAFTILYTGHWLYKADHIKKTIVLVDIDKVYKNKDRKSLAKSIFRSDILTAFVDSVLLKSARIKSYEADGDIVKTELVFYHNPTIEKMAFSYNRKTNMPVNYDITVFQVTETTVRGKKGMKETIKCSDFKKVNDNALFDTKRYFTSKGDNTVLTKYKNYKLTNKM